MAHNADTAFYLAIILEQKGDREGAVRLFNRALEAPRAVHLQERGAEPPRQTQGGRRR